MVESNIHYPTDSTLLGDRDTGTDPHHEEDRVQVGRSERQGAGPHAQHTQTGSGHCLIDAAVGEPGEERRKREYRKLLSLTRKVMNQAQRVLAEVKQGRRRRAVEGLAQSLETMVGRVRQVMKQARIRIFGGDTKSLGKIVGGFEPQTEIIR